MTRDPWSVLTAHQAAVARPFLAERERERAHLVVYLSGAHAYGFPSPDSDLDLKCVHVAPTGDLVGLERREGGAEQTVVVDGVELDYGSNEVGGVLHGILKGNGNYLERILGDLALGPEVGTAKGHLAEARLIARPLLSRRVARHYGGFATSQLKLFDAKPSAKRALYVLRTAATGRCLLARAELETDVGRLADFVPAEISELIAIKLRGERELLAADHAASWRARLVAAIAALNAAVATSVLPAEPPAAAIAAADTWLIELRRASW